MWLEIWEGMSRTVTNHPCSSDLPTEPKGQHGKTSLPWLQALYIEFKLSQSHLPAWYVTRTHMTARVAKRACRCGSKALASTFKTLCPRLPPWPYFVQGSGRRRRIGVRDATRVREARRAQGARTGCGSGGSMYKDCGTIGKNTTDNFWLGKYRRKLAYLLCVHWEYTIVALAIGKVQRGYLKTAACSWPPSCGGYVGQCMKSSCSAQLYQSCCFRR